MNGEENNQNHITFNKNGNQYIELNELKSTIEHLKGEIETYRIEKNKLKANNIGIDSSITSIKKDASICEKRIKAYPDILEKLKSLNDSIIIEVNMIKLRIKTSRKDEENYLSLIEVLKEEIKGLKDVRAIVLKKIKNMEEALKEIVFEKEQNLPKLKQYDELLKDINIVFQETKSRMDLNVTLKSNMSYIRNKDKKNDFS